MSQSRTTTGVFLVILLAVIGYILVMLPPRLVEQYYHAHSISPWIAYVYAGTVGFGALLLSGLLISILLHIWKNTRQKSAERERRMRGGASPPGFDGDNDKDTERSRGRS